MRFSVLSYNVLHQIGAARLLRGRGGGSPTWAADRLLQVAELVKRLDPDVACLQEVDPAAQAAISRALGDGFECAAVMQNAELPPRDGCATFVRKSRFQVVRTHQLRMRDVVAEHFPRAEGIRKTGGGFSAALWRELHEKLNLAVAVHLRAADEGAGAAEVCVATTHLFFDPAYPDLKLLQAFLLARDMEAFAQGHPLVLAGDLNSTPETDCRQARSGVYELLTRGSLPPGHPHHPVAMRPGRGILAGVQMGDVPEFTVAPFRSAYHEAFQAEGPITNAARGFQGCLDYIMYRGPAGAAPGAGPRLRLVGARPLPPEGELLPQLPLPSAAHPSDHLPLLAEFELA